MTRLHKPLWLWDSYQRQNLDLSKSTNFQWKSLHRGMDPSSCVNNGSVWPWDSQGLTAPSPSQTRRPGTINHHFWADLLEKLLENGNQSSAMNFAKFSSFQCFNCGGFSTARDWEPPQVMVGSLLSMIDKLWLEKHPTEKNTEKTPGSLRLMLVNH